MSETALLRLLVVEDDSSLSQVLCDEFRARGHEVRAATSIAEARASLKEAAFDVAIIDLILPDGSGLEVLQQIRDEDLSSEAIVLTGYGTLTTAIEAMKLGAYDYLTKPTKMEELELLVQKAGEKALLRRENTNLRARIERLEPIPGLVTADARMKAILETLERIAPSDLPALIQGESGTGKELVAKAIHQRSHRAKEAFVAVNCAAVPQNLLESELFGYERGAFTGAVNRKPGLFELADRGVLFLDEVAEVDVGVQPKLLRAIETKEFYHVGGTRPIRSNVRIVAATNKDLKVETKANRFREDLYYRLAGVTLVLPPLRDRPDDVPLLARHFLRRYAGPTRRFSQRALDVLRAYPWPGNVRELSMAVQRAALLCASEVIGHEDLPPDVGGDKAWASVARRTGVTLAEMEREYVESVLKAHRGHRGRTAEALGIDPKTLYNKLKQWGAE